MTAGTQPIADAATAQGPRWRLPRINPRVGWGLVGFFVVVIPWELIVQAGMIKKVVLSHPTAILQTGFQDLFVFTTKVLADETVVSVPPVLWPHLQISITEYLLGFGLAAVTGIFLGLLLGMNRRTQYLVEPWLDAIYATPTIALVPLIIIILGLGLEKAIFVVWLEAIFVIVVTIMTGVHSVEKSHMDTATSFGATRWLRFRSVILPTAVPFILTGLRFGATRALVGVVVAELLASNAGIGFYINSSGTFLRTDKVMFGVVLLGLFGIVVGEGIRRIENRFEKWRPAIK
jgi:ABC-type nitrate/sulfonate/bicarbonate transport system permease component